MLCVQKANNSFEHVSVIISTYNEAEVIGRKLDNISELNYPKEKMEILVLDDASTDGTGELASKKLAEKELFGRVIRFERRLGLNRSLNKAIEESKYDIICITDSDVMLERNSLKNAICVLKGFKDAGGVTGKVRPVSSSEGFAQSSEKAYRGFYDKMMLAESSLHSAFPGNGPLVIFDKTKISSKIPVEYGSSDGNIAMNVIKSGLRYIYVSNAIIFEPMPENLGQQRLQKVRRAQRLIQVFFHNYDVFLNKKFDKFGTKIFPLKFLIITLCPLIGLIGFSLLIASILLSQSVFLYQISLISLGVVAAFLLVFSNLRNSLSCFLFHQIYLVAGLFLSFRKSFYWRTIDRDSHIPLDAQGVDKV